MYGKLKSWLLDDALFYSVLILLIGLVAFQLGRYSERSQLTQQANVASVTFIESDEEEAVESEASEPVVASRSGSKYHLLDCPGAKQMKEENKIYFDTFAAAAAAGYEPAGNCPGL